MNPHLPPPNDMHTQDVLNLSYSCPCVDCEKARIIPVEGFPMIEVECTLESECEDAICPFWKPNWKVDENGEWFFFEGNPVVPK